METRAGRTYPKSRRLKEEEEGREVSFGFSISL